ncbi:MAG: hypothetical protein A2946_01920 [Candidatus Liptonbacteria bacterium RIFCSPLOWO2_01_FULL_53_13]|uniref:Uncharacterized protein n=1 Tax=Candidatus Liptonbacteria bacterium RIFCSPLOWO2_01_FULL_53_13 TaxID=1798651 RepID=A0A1G2CK38_9BACT|nr:MAG: hypothetical protein A2946_01920 [Candidatus Liptonbacteria bacterium RIFCSPLOWO2_01_FULL_53_13]
MVNSPSIEVKKLLQSPRMLKIYHAECLGANWRFEWPSTALLAESDVFCFDRLSAPFLSFPRRRS